MRRTIFLALLAALLIAPVARADETAIYKDCQDDSRLEGHYSVSRAASGARPTCRATSTSTPTAATCSRARSPTRPRRRRRRARRAVAAAAPPAAAPAPAAAAGRRLGARRLARRLQPAADSADAAPVVPSTPQDQRRALAGRDPGRAARQPRRRHDRARRRLAARRRRRPQQPSAAARARADRARRRRGRRRCAAHPQPWHPSPAAVGRTSRRAASRPPRRIEIPVPLEGGRGLAIADRARDRAQRVRRRRRLAAGPHDLDGDRADARRRGAGRRGARAAAPRPARPRGCAASTRSARSPCSPRSRRASLNWSLTPGDSWLESSRTFAYLATMVGGAALARLAPRRWSRAAGRRPARLVRDLRLGAADQGPTGRAGARTSRSRACGRRSTTGTASASRRR